MALLHWLNEKPNIYSSVTWGCPWEKGTLQAGDVLTLTDSMGHCYPIQTWPMAYWPDGSIKWSGQSGCFAPQCDETYTLSKTNTQAETTSSAIHITENDASFTIDTLAMQCTLYKKGRNIIQINHLGNKCVKQVGYLKALSETRQNEATLLHTYYSEIRRVTMEQNGPLRAVFKVEGVHTDGNRTWLPFTLRLYFACHDASFKLVHTFFFDGDPLCDFIKGLGLTFDFSLSADPYNRHIRYVLDDGVYTEPSKLLLCRRYHEDNASYRAQINGEEVAIENLPSDHRLQAGTNAVWNDFKLSQDCADHFKLRKRCGDDLTYIDMVHGHRAGGLMYAGDNQLGMALCMKNFWQKYPAALETSGLGTSQTSLTAWLWDPSSEAMDLRHYSHSPHLNAYEGFEEMRSTPVGIANTSEMTVTCYNHLPSGNELMLLNENTQNPPLLVCSPTYYHDTKAFGSWWDIPDKSKPSTAFFENQLDSCFDFYQNEIEQRHWYGYWNFGDVMHTYDGVRHQWRYDLGGFAWQNTELAPNIWLWYQFLRTGRFDIYKMAENMTRHTSEVDRYHFGEYCGLGSRHNVVHWGCSCKEVRISMAGLFKPYYYLTADERTGDLLTEVKDVDHSVDTLEPLRTYFPDSPEKNHLRVGPDWSTFTSNWETQWERTKDPRYLDKILNGMNYLKTLPLRLLSGPAMTYDTKTSSLHYMDDGNTRGYHMEICFGAPQVWSELGDLLEDETWKDMLAEYGTFYLLPNEEKLAKSNGKISDFNCCWPMFATGLAAYGAKRNHDLVTGERAWRILAHELNKDTNEIIATRPVHTWRHLVDDPNVTTNCIAQWCINTIMCLALISDMIPEDLLLI